MDTRFWGPSGWQLLHLIAQEYPDNPDGLLKRRYEIFFNSIKDILPCRFCRESTTAFMAEELPLHPALKSRETLTRWVYDLHNRVNKKLRDQCKEDPRIICPSPNPTYAEVVAKYNDLLSVRPNVPPGMDFMYCVVYNYPKEVTSDRLRVYFDFFMNLYDVYPYTALRKILQDFIDDHIVYDALTSNRHLKVWFHNMMKALAKYTGDVKVLPSWNKIAFYSSASCQKKSYHGKTCRNKKTRKRRNHARTFKITHSRLVLGPVQSV